MASTASKLVEGSCFISNSITLYNICFLGCINKSVNICKRKAM